MFEWLSVKNEIFEVRLELWPTRWMTGDMSRRRRRTTARRNSAGNERQKTGRTYTWVRSTMDIRECAEHVRHDKTHVIRLKNVMRRQRRKGTDAQAMDKRDRSLIVRIHVAWTRRGSPPREPWDRNLVTRDALGSDEVAISGWSLEDNEYVSFNWNEDIRYTLQEVVNVVVFSVYTQKIRSIGVCIHLENTRYWCGAVFECE